MAKRFLIMKSGLLGDTLVSLPALHCLRSAFRDAHITYVWQQLPSKSVATPPDILRDSGLVDRFIGYSIEGNYWQRNLAIVKLFLSLRINQYDIGIVLEAPFWPATRKSFLRWSGIPLVVGPDGRQEKIYRSPDGNLPQVEHIADSLVSVLRPIVSKLPGLQDGIFRLPLSNAEQIDAVNWCCSRGWRQNGTLVAFAPGSNMASKRWPLESFAAVGRHLIDEFGIMPIVVGGPDDRDRAVQLITRWGIGINATGELSVRQGVAVLAQCRLFVGNDTGTMHMAVAAGVRCVAIFASIDMPGRWSPYGAGHHIFRLNVPCSGCLLRECDMGDQHCIRLISATEVTRACVDVLTASIQSLPTNVNLTVPQTPDNSSI